VMDILEKSAGGGGGPEFMSTHPRPANRKEYIKEILDKIPAEFRNGLKGTPRRQNQIRGQQQQDGLNIDPNINLDLD